MRKRFGAAAIAAAGTVALAIGGGASAHRQIIIVNSYGGHYDGFFASAVTGDIATFSMELTPSHLRQYEGTLNAGGNTTPFHVTISAAGGFAATSGGPAGFVVTGGVAPFGGSLLAASSYTLRTPAGQDRGSLRFIRSFGSGDASQLLPAVQGNCSFADGSVLPATLRVSATDRGAPGFTGGITVGAFSAPLVGSVDNPDLRTGLTALVATGVSPGGSIDLAGTWVSSSTPHMQVTATISLGDGSVRVGDCALLPAVRPTGGQ